MVEQLTKIGLNLCSAVFITVIMVCYPAMGSPPWADSVSESTYKVKSEQKGNQKNQSPEKIQKSDIQEPLSADDSFSIYGIKNLFIEDEKIALALSRDKELDAKFAQNQLKLYKLRQRRIRSIAAAGAMTGILRAQIKDMSENANCFQTEDAQVYLNEKISNLKDIWSDTKKICIKSTQSQVKRTKTAMMQWCNKADLEFQKELDVIQEVMREYKQVEAKCR
ncbi:MAG: hypothetical protein HQL69_02585 [Magnetococcales bacterium]|nr:hypothetical protein [Magnetococcales bacterium]